MECRFCKTVFADKYKLDRHQKSAKFCLEIQKSHEDPLVCKLCNKRYMSERDLKAHTCDSNSFSDFKELQQVIKNMQTRIYLLEEEIEKIKKEPAIKRKNKLSDIQPLNNEEFNLILKNITIDDIRSGPEGMGLFLYENYLNSRLVCLDVQRRKFCYQNEAGELVQEYDLSYLIPSLFEIAKDNCLCLINELNRERKTQIRDGDDLEETDYEDMANLTDTKFDIENVCKGNNTTYKARLVKFLACATNVSRKL